MTQIVALNVNHQTRAKTIKPGMVEALVELSPDVVVLTEYVEGNGRDTLRADLANAGLSHVALSETVAFRPRQWHNQVLIATRNEFELVCRSAASVAPHAQAGSNILSVNTHGIVITGVRVPAYKRTRDLHDYWAWLNYVLDGDVVIGDFNADPFRLNKRDRFFVDLATQGGWIRANAEGAWSYRSSSGNTSRIDHALVRGDAQIRAARYIQDPFVPEFTDHAALVVEVLS